MAYLETRPNIMNAINALEPTAHFSCVGEITYSNIEWNPDFDVSKKPTQASTETKLAEMLVEWDAQEYIRNRQSDYPDMREQFHKIYDDGLTKWKSEMVDPVKAKWPKDNSGPIE